MPQLPQSLIVDALLRNFTTAAAGRDDPDVALPKISNRRKWSRRSGVKRNGVPYAKAINYLPPFVELLATPALTACENVGDGGATGTGNLRHPLAIIVAKSGI